MKDFFTITLFSIFLSFSVSAQNFNKFAIEVVAGTHIPLSPNDGISRSNYVSFGSFGAAFRYNFKPNLGVRGSYNYHGFSNSEDSSLETIFHNFTAEAVYNLGKAFNLSHNFYRNFGLLAHGGAGISFNNPAGINSTDHIGHIKLGLTPQVKINENVAFFIDGSYIVNLKQHWGFDGQSLDADKKGKTGGFATLSFGLMVYFGENTSRPHADWY